MTFAVDQISINTDTIRREGAVSAFAPVKKAITSMTRERSVGDIVGEVRNILHSTIILELPLISMKIVLNLHSQLKQAVFQHE